MTSNGSLLPHTDNLHLQVGTYNEFHGNQNQTTYNIFLPSTSAASPRNARSGTTCPSFNDAPLGLLSDDFTGQEQVMVRIIEILDTSHGDMPSRCALYGMRGVGKSHVAYALAKFLFDKRRYRNIFRIRATSNEALYEDICHLLDLVSHPDRLASEQNTRLTAARRWLEDFNDGKWLLIVDDVARETVSFLRQHLPRQNSQGCILFTTVTEVVAEALTRDAGERHGMIELCLPDVDEAAKLLLKLLGNDHAAADANTVKDVVKGVGCLPLAIVQATAYMKESGLTLEEMLALLKSQRKVKVISPRSLHSQVCQLIISHSWSVGRIISFGTRKDPSQRPSFDNFGISISISLLRRTFSRSWRTWILKASRSNCSPTVLPPYRLHTSKRHQPIAHRFPS